MEKRQQHFSIGYLITTLIIVLFLQSVLSHPYEETITYSQFKSLVKKGMVIDLVIGDKT